MDPEPTVPAQSDSDSHAQPNLAAVAATVSVVGVLVAALLTWLVVRLRRTAQQPSVSRRPVSYPFRPSFAPSEASSKFGFIRKPLRLSHRHKDASWDFADPDPFAHPKESALDPPSPKHRPAPLPPTPAYTPRAQRASMLKDDARPHTPTTPDCIDSPPPAYCRD